MSRRKKEGTRLFPALDKQATSQLQTALHQLQAGNMDRAGAMLEQLASSLPSHPLVYFHYGNYLWHVGKLVEAARCYRSVLELQSDNAHATGNLGAVLWALGEQNEALEYYRKAIKLDPNNACAYYNLGGAYFMLDKGEEAVRAFRSALRINPDYVDAYKYLGNSYYEQGYYSKAVECYKKVTALAPSGGARVRVAMAIPIIPESIDHIDGIRSQLHRSLDELLSQDLYIKDPMAENGYTNFFLAYHGRSNRQIQEKYAQLYSQACPSLNYTAQHCRVNNVPAKRKIKVGFISKFLTGHSIGNTSRGLIAELSRDKFHIVAIFLGGVKGHIGDLISRSADQTAVLSGNLDAARKLINDLELDILFYQDIGMDPYTYFLAHSRLAPVQCVSFGHPDTTGIRNMDYFISTDFYEPEDGDKHYSESLFKLKGVSSCAYYYRPALPDLLKPRRHFGLSNNKHIYICPQTLFKLHPEFDNILANILRADPDGQVVLIEGMHPHWAELLRNRFKRTIADVTARILFVPYQKGDDFINLIAISDVMLDTIHFCGQNTSHAGFSAGIPIVTLPGEFHRGRHTLGFYKRMGFMDCVANSKEEYVDIAVRLATDSRFRSDVIDKIHKYRDVIWEERRVIDEFERFFTEATQKV